MEIKAFLEAVISTPTGYFCLATRKESWVEHWYKWPEDVDSIIEHAQQAASEYDVYFSSYLFSEPCSQKLYVLPSRTIQADLDEADVDNLPLRPSVLVESSPDRHQAYWFLNDATDLEEHEAYSKRLTYSITRCDRSGWALGRKLRIPNTLNHKYSYPVEVKVIDSLLLGYGKEELDLLPDVGLASDSSADGWLDEDHPVFDTGPNEMLTSFKNRMAASVVNQYGNLSKDRSAALWALECALLRAGATRDQVFYIAKASPNNKFKDLSRGEDRELGKDILRAEAEIKANLADARAAIMSIRKGVGIPAEKRKGILDIVIKMLNNEGRFAHTEDENIWYIRRDLGRPVVITTHSEYLNMILDIQFGLNRSETEQSYVVGGLSAYAYNLPVHGFTASLSHYDRKANCIYLHTGKREVYRIAKDGITSVVNGQDGAIFPWIAGSEPFVPSYSSLEKPWHEILFGGCFDNCISLTCEEASTLLQVWLLFLFFRDDAIARPILALLGHPGSGKSTLFRRIYALLYGRSKNLGAVTTPEDYDHASSSDPLLVLDNVDTWEKWLPDRLAASAACIDISKRKLYTDLDTVVLRRQALIGVTAHSPKFGREDVADRMLILNFERLPHFKPEGEIIDSIVNNRARLWGSLIRDMQKVLASPYVEDIPQFRIEDFARVGSRIAQATGKLDAFKAALGKVATAQKAFSLDEEQILTVALHHMVASSNGKADAWKTPSQLWEALTVHSPDSTSFIKMYRNAVYLSNKIWTMHDALKEMFNLEWKRDTTQGTRVWKIKEKV